MELPIDKYLNDEFPDLKIESPLFYNADIGIRFEIGDTDPYVSDERYREQVHYRSTQLFKATHYENDDIYIILYLDIKRKHNKTHKLKVFRNGVKDKNILRNLSCKSIMQSDEDYVGWESYRFVLMCKVSEIRYITFLHSDYNIFIINKTKHTIFHFYDSRGLDVVSNSKDALQQLFLKYNDWILDYDREIINSVFENK